MLITRSHIRRVVAAGVAAVGLALLSAGPAEAGVFEVAPTRVDLSAAKRSQLLTVHNTGHEISRFQVTAFAWQQRPDGTMALAKTDDLIVYPTLLTVAPSTSRRIRIGTRSTQAGAVEKSYRIFVTQLPPVRKREPGRVIVLARMGIPVFVSPRHVRQQPVIETARIAHGRLDVDVENRGSVHYMLQAVHVTGRDAGGDELFRRSMRGWYVLAGGRRSLSLDLPDERCDRLAAVDIEAVTSQGAIRKRAQVGARNCAR